ncbi:MAG: sugar phosphate isomerase/epimerase [Ruminococcaceae bacterium]|nr:sugar phosphate isomerase/epimerase [Oscillospiraceae bacterium]
MEKIFLQLYSVRDEMQKDFGGTLKKVADMGFHGVEFAGFFGYDAAYVRTALNSLGLASAGSTYGFLDFENNLEEIIAYNKILGNQNITCGITSSDFIPGDYPRYTAILAKAAESFAQAGMRLYYHNHAHEFTLLSNGKRVYDVMLEPLEGAIGNQFDIYWLYRAGVDVVEYFEKYRTTLGLLHIKDGDENGGLPIGAGKVDIKKAFDYAVSLGVDSFVLEDESDGDQFNAVKICLDYFLAL